MVWDLIMHRTLVYTTLDVQRRSMFFATWYKAALLASETGPVIHLRLWRIAAGGRGAVDESVLMVREKMDAACEAGCDLATGGTLLSVIERYRGHVAANVQRLRSQPQRPA